MSTAGPLEIRALTPADAAIGGELVAWMAAAWGFELTPEQVQRRAEELKAALRTDDPAKAARLIARVDGRLAGHCETRRGGDGADPWWVVGLIVDPGRRRNGIGTALVRACVEHAHRHGATAMRAAVRATNLGSIRLHERLGFEHQEAFTAENGDENVVLALSVA